MSAVSPERKARNAAARHAKYVSDPEWRAVLKARNHEQYLKNRERRIAEAKAYYEAHPNRKRDRDRARRADPVLAAVDREKGRVQYHKHREKRLERMRRDRPALRLREHGLTQEAYDAMLVGQGNRCAICLSPFTDTPRIDHDHSTGEVRGLLCHNCNVTLGHARDNQANLMAAIEYLAAPAERLEQRVKRAIFDGMRA